MKRFIYDVLEVLREHAGLILHYRLRYYMKLVVIHCPFCINTYVRKHCYKDGNGHCFKVHFKAT